MERVTDRSIVLRRSRAGRIGGSFLLVVTALAALAGTAGAASPSTPAPVMTASPTALSFGNVAVGQLGSDQIMTVTNTGTATENLTGFVIGGANPNDFASLSICPPADVDINSNVITLPPGSSCSIGVIFSPGNLGARSAVLTFQDNEVTPLSIPLSGSGTEGYDVVTAEGAVVPYGNAQRFGDLGGQHLNAPVVGMAVSPTGGGYWLLGQDGGLFAFGDAGFFGSTGNLHLNKPVIGLAPTFDGQGYLLVASDGGIFAFGDALFFGSTGDLILNKPIVGMAMTPDGFGYWMVASDGGVFAFGDAGYFGSTGAMTLNKPIVGMVPTADGNGYWLVASDGGVFAFGDAPFRGSTGNRQLARPIVSAAGTPSGNGYWFVGADGGVFAFGDAPFYGSATGVANAVALAPTGSAGLQFLFQQVLGGTSFGPRRPLHEPQVFNRFFGSNHLPPASP